MSEQPISVPKGDEKEKSLAEEGAKKLKPCCACPETKRARDQWYVPCRYSVLLERISFKTDCSCS